MNHRSSIISLIYLFYLGIELSLIIPGYQTHLACRQSITCTEEYTNELNVEME